MRPERIVIGTDFSAASFEAARWAARHLGHDRELVLAHVVAIPEPPPIMRGKFPRRDLLVETVREGADRRLRELSHSLSAERIWLEIREGDVTTTLAQIARDFAPALLVVGAQGERPGRAATLGSTAERLVRSVDVPVLLVGAAPADEPARILVPVDRSPETGEALRWAAVLREALDASVSTLHVVPSGVMSSVLAAGAILSGTAVPEPVDHRSEAEPNEHWVELATGAGIPRERVTGEVAFGEPGHEIVAAAERLGAGLIVMGRRAAGNVRRAVLGSVVDAVLRHAPCPVLVVPEAEDAAGASSSASDANTTSATPTATVQRMFAAFGAGDLDALLETVHAESRWTYYGANPRLTAATLVGRAEVRRFFEGIFERLTMTEFNTDQYVAQGDTVVIFGSEAGTVRATGQPFRNAWAQKYVVRDALIVEMAEYNVQIEPRG